MKTRRALLLILVAILTWVSPAFAQKKSRQIKTGKTQVFVSGLYNSGSFRFTDQRSFTLNVEEGSFTGRWSRENGPAFGFGVSRDVLRGISVGVAVDILSNTPRESVQVRVPHPFYFGRPRDIEREDVALSYNERAFHVLVGYSRREGRVIAGVSGGPSYFSTRTELVDGFTFRESFPFDTAELQSTQSRSYDAGKLGFNVGGWLGYLIRDHLAVGADLRYSGAKARFTTSGGSEIQIDAGGARLGGGIRVLF